MAKKATPKRRSEDKGTKRKRDGDLKREESDAKKKRVESVVSLGHSRKLSDRHKGQLACLAALITSKKTELRATDSIDDVLQGDNSCSGLYMEWSKEKESYFLYASSQARSVVLKFELLAFAGLEAVPENIEIKKPVLVFSEEFGNGRNWDDTKMLLFELFSKSDADVNCAEDYLYAFTRCQGKIYFRIYKINSLPGADKEGSLDQVFATFVLKPVEIHCTDSVDYFLYTEKLLMSEGDNSLTVISSPVSTGKPYLGTIQHLQCLGLYNLMLPTPPDLSEWEGFNTNISEYVDRYHAFKRSKVPGIGPERIPQATMTFPQDHYWHLCLLFKVFARSLIVCVGNTFKTKACYLDIKKENIFLRGKTVKILGVNLIDYSLERAVCNLNNVGFLIQEQLKEMGLREENFPADLKGVLYMLKKSFQKSHRSGRKSCCGIKNFICWMDGEERNHVIDDLLQDFLYCMGHFDHIEVGLNFPTFTEWVEMFEQKNFLLRLARITTCQKTRKLNKRWKIGIKRKETSFLNV